MNRNVIGAGCLALFGVPFAAGGLFGLALVKAAVQRGDPARQVFLIACFAVVFSLAGFGMIVGAFLGASRVRHDGELRARHPDAPWLWNQEWADRRILDDSRRAMFSLWAFTVFWNSIASPILFFIPDELNKRNYVFLFLLIFPLIGLFLLVGAVRATLRTLRFHRSTLHLDTLPAPVGGPLRGRVEVPYPLMRASSIVARLTSTVTRQSGKSTTTSIEWQEEVEVTPASLGQTGSGVTIPIEIGIPSDASPSDPASDSVNKREWRLTVDAELPGIDYSAGFSVPVFRTAFSEVRPPRTLHTPVAEPRQPRSFAVQHTTEGVEIDLPPFRAPGSAIGATVFALLFAAAVYPMLQHDLPILFPIVCGLFALLLGWAALGLLFGSTKIIITHDTITIRNRTLFWRSEKRAPRSDIASVDLKVETQQTGSRVTPFYEVQVRPTLGRRITAANYIRSKREAEWLAAQIRRR